LLSNPLTYLKKHWNGQFSLAWAFWVNFIALRFAIAFVQTKYLPPPDTDYSAITAIIIALIFLFHGVVFIWQIVGVLRSGEIYLQETGSQATVWGAQLALVIGLFLTVSYALQAWQTTIPIPDEENFMVKMDREHASKYELKSTSNGKTLSIKGTIELGITRNVRAFLEINPAISSVTLNSAGGNIYEARGLANLFKTNNLATHIDESCTSACTLAFIGGNKRTLSDEAKLGFHQYRIDATYSVLNADPKAEQEKDQALFERSGVSAEFVEKMFTATASQMWFPTKAELLAAGVVHAIDR